MSDTTERFFIGIVIVILMLAHAILARQERKIIQTLLSAYQDSVNVLIKNCNFSSAEFNESTREMARLNAEDIETLMKMDIVQFELSKSIIDAMGVEPEPMNPTVYAVEVEK